MAIIFFSFVEVCSCKIIGALHSRKIRYDWADPKPPLRLRSPAHFLYFAGAMRFHFLSLSWLIACVLLAATVSAQDLDPKDVVTSLDQALPIAIAKAKVEFPDLNDYILYSVHPRVLKADPNGLHWEVVWKTKAFPHHKALIVRVYMKDASTIAEREPVADPH